MSLNFSMVARMSQNFAKYGVLLVLLFHASAFADLKSDFRQAYKSYNQYLEVDDFSLALGSAADAYKLGSKLYGKKHITTAKLAINYASLLNDMGEYKKAAKTLKGKLKVMEKAYGDDAHDLVSLLVEVGRANFDPNKPEKALEHFQRASEILANHQNPIVTGARNFDIVGILLKRRANLHTRPFVEAAYKAYRGTLVDNDVRLGLVNYHMALFAANDGRLIDSIEHLDYALTAFKSDGPQMGSLERTARLMLVDVLERVGNSEQATKHCLAIGQRQEWRQPASPLYLKVPGFKLENAGEAKEGRVTVSFTVDERGFVRNPRVASSTAPGLNEAALAVITDFRYAPRFVDGDPVATAGVDFTMNYDFTAETRKPRLTRPPVRGMMDSGSKDGQSQGGFGGFGGGGGK